VDSQVPQERALDLSMRAKGYLPRLVVVILQPEKDFDFLQACVKAGVDQTRVEPVDLGEVMGEAGELVRNKLRAADAARQDPAAAPEPSEPPPEEVAPAAPGAGGMVLAFVSAKDGEGKSTVALNLTLALAKHFGKRAIYVDLAETLSETAMMLNTQPPGTYRNLLAMEPPELASNDWARFAIDVFGDGQALAVCGNNGIVPPEVDRDRLDLLIRFLRSQCDFLILDCPVQFCDNLKIALKLADWHVAVVQNTLSSLRNVRMYLAELKRLEYPAHQVRVVLNRVSPSAGLSREDLARNLDPYPIAGAIVSNGPVAIESINVGVPVMVHAPGSDLAESITNFAKTLLGIESSDILSSQEISLSSMFSSLFGK